MAQIPLYKRLPSRPNFKLNNIPGTSENILYGSKDILVHKALKKFIYIEKILRQMPENKI